MSPTAAAVEPIAYCINTAQQAAGGVMIKRADGVGLRGLVLGAGARGVVLANMNGTDLCDWLTPATELADKGYSVALFNYSDDKLDEDVVAAAGTLRDRGAKSVVLMGASMGGAMVISAAAKLDPAPDAVVALSPPSAYDGIDALAAAGRITVPTFIAVGSADAGFPEPAKALHDAITSKEKTLKTVNDNSHGTALLYDAATMAEVITFIGAHSAK